MKTRKKSIIHSNKVDIHRLVPIFTHTSALRIVEINKNQSIGYTEYHNLHQKDFTCLPHEWEELPPNCLEIKKSKSGKVARLKTLPEIVSLTATDFEEGKAFNLLQKQMKILPFIQNWNFILGDSTHSTYFNKTQPLLHYDFWTFLFHLPALNHPSNIMEVFQRKTSSRLIEYSFIPKKVLVVGDFHGDIHALMSILQKWRERKIINDFFEVDLEYSIFFSGDLVDRGLYGPEVLGIVLYLYKKNINVFFSCGNHDNLNNGIWDEQGSIHMLLQCGFTRNWKGRYQKNDLQKMKTHSSSNYNQLIYQMEKIPYGILFEENQRRVYLCHGLPRLSPFSPIENYYSQEILEFKNQLDSNYLNLFYNKRRKTLTEKIKTLQKQLDISNPKTHKKNTQKIEKSIQNVAKNDLQNLLTIQKKEINLSFHDLQRFLIAKKKMSKTLKELKDLGFSKENINRLKKLEKQHKMYTQMIYKDKDKYFYNKENNNDLTVWQWGRAKMGHPGGFLSFAQDIDGKAYYGPLHLINKNNKINHSKIESIRQTFKSLGLEGSDEEIMHSIDWVYWFNRQTKETIILRGHDHSESILKVIPKANNNQLGYDFVLQNYHNFML